MICPLWTAEGIVRHLLPPSTFPGAITEAIHRAAWGEREAGQRRRERGRERERGEEREVVVGGGGGSDGSSERYDVFLMLSQVYVYTFDAVLRFNPLVL